MKKVWLNRHARSIKQVKFKQDSSYSWVIQKIKTIFPLFFQKLQFSQTILFTFSWFMPNVLYSPILRLTCYIRLRLWFRSINSWHFLNIFQNCKFGVKLQPANFTCRGLEMIDLKLCEICRFRSYLSNHTESR